MGARSTGRPTHAVVVTLRSGGRVQARQVALGAGFLASSSPVLHFGVADAEALGSLEIRWPSGRRELFRGVEVNRRHRFREGR